MATVNAKPDLRWAMHCDTHVEFFATKAEADAAAFVAIQECRNASKGPGGVWDGWDEFTAERIVVMQVVERATVIPGAHYSQDDWRMQPVKNVESVDYRDCLDLAAAICDAVETYDGDDLMGRVTPVIKPLIGRLLELESPRWCDATEIKIKQLRRQLFTAQFTIEYASKMVADRDVIQKYLRDALADKPIPVGIYYNVEHDNFYTIEGGRGCGTDFYNEWNRRAEEFPNRWGERK